MAEQLLEYYLENEVEDQADKYTFVVASFFREKGAPSLDEVISSLVYERAKHTIAGNDRVMLG